MLTELYLSYSQFIMLIDFAINYKKQGKIEVTSSPFVIRMCIIVLSSVSTIMHGGSVIKNATMI